MRLRSLVPATTLALCAFAVAAHADTVTFDYTTPAGSAYPSSGTGSFSYAGSLTSIGLSQLTVFSFVLSVNDGGTVDTFDLANLTSFSATVTDGAVSALSLATEFVQPTPSYSFPEDFIVTGLGSGQAQNDSNSPDGVLVVNQGIVTTNGPGLPSSPVPEPASIALLGTGILGLVGAARRRLLSRQ